MLTKMWYVTCDATTPHAPDCPNLSPDRDTGTEARRAAKREGWKQSAYGLDYSPECWKVYASDEGGS